MNDDRPTAKREEEITQWLKKEKRDVEVKPEQYWKLLKLLNDFSEYDHKAKVDSITDEMIENENRDYNLSKPFIKGFTRGVYWAKQQLSLKK